MTTKAVVERQHRATRGQRARHKPALSVLPDHAQALLRSSARDRDPSGPILTAAVAEPPS